MRVNYAIIFVSDMARSVAFYRDVLGFELKFQSPHWTEFFGDGAALALHLAEAPPAPPEDPEKVPPARCRPGLSVPNLDEFHQRMLEQGVKCTQEPKLVFGTKIANYVDPDGLGISVSEARKA